MSWHFIHLLHGPFRSRFRFLNRSFLCSSFGVCSRPKMQSNHLPFAPPNTWPKNTPIQPPTTMPPTTPPGPGESNLANPPSIAQAGIMKASDRTILSVFIQASPYGSFDLFGADSCVSHIKATRLAACSLSAGTRRSSLRASPQARRKSESNQSSLALAWRVGDRCL